MVVSINLKNLFFENNINIFSSNLSIQKYKINGSYAFDVVKSTYNKEHMRYELVMRFNESTTIEGVYNLDLKSNFSLFGIDIKQIDNEFNYKISPIDVKVLIDLANNETSKKLHVKDLNIFISKLGQNLEDGIFNYSSDSFIEIIENSKAIQIKIMELIYDVLKVTLRNHLDKYVSDFASVEDLSQDFADLPMSNNKYAWMLFFEKYYC